MPQLAGAERDLGDDVQNHVRQDGQATFWNAEFFSQGALRYAQAVAWREKQESRPTVLRGFDEAGSSHRGDHRSAAAHFLAALSETKLVSHRLHSAVRDLCEKVGVWAREANAERGITLGVQGFHGEAVLPQIVPATEDLHAARVVYLFEKTAYEAAIAALVLAAEPYSFAPDGPFRSALAMFEKQRHWEGLNLCLTDMAVAMTVTAQPLSNEVRHQDQGRASEVVGGRWAGEPRRLLSFCEAALLKEAYLTASEVVHSGGDPFLMSHRHNEARVGYLRVRGDDAVNRLKVADALAPIPATWRLDLRDSETRLGGVDHDESAAEPVGEPVSEPTDTRIDKTLQPD